MKKRWESSTRHRDAARQPSMVRSNPSGRIPAVIVLAAASLIPVFISIGATDPFRTPKHLLLLGTGIVLAAVALMGAILSPGASRPQGRWSPSSRVIIGSILGWSAIATLASTNRALSIFSLLTAAAATMFFVAAYIAIQRRSLGVLYFALFPALVNAIIALGQRLTGWSPVPWGPNEVRPIGLLGNANDLGMFLLAPALAALALGLESRKHRFGGFTTALIVGAGIVASGTRGAILAFVVGCFLLFVFTRPRTSIVAGFILLLLASSLALHAPWQGSHRMQFADALRTGDYDRILSGRVIGFLAAWRMFRQRPLIGVGPGCYSFHYFDEKLAIDDEYPELARNSRLNFGEAHNEHLQILAEGGIPAYGTFIAALGLLAGVSIRRRHAGADDTRANFARRLALPLAAAIFVLTLSAFPFRLAAPTVSILFFSAACLAWRENGST